MESLLNLPWYVYLFLSVSAAFYIVFQVFPKLKRAKQVLLPKSYLRNAKGPDIAEEQFKGLSVGAINAEQISAYIDSLETGMDLERLTNGLSEWWGIDNRSDAIDVLDGFKKVGHRAYFNNLLPIFLNHDKSRWAILIREQFQEVSRTTQFLNNMASTVDYLVKEKIISNKHDLQLGILGWDMGRMVSVARMCADMRYISADEAWGYINYALSESRQAFEAWGDLGRSYVIGRSMWSGAGGSLAGIVAIYKGLTSDANSPWNMYPLR